MAVGLTRSLWIVIGTLFVIVPFLPLSPRAGMDAGPVWWLHVQAWVLGIVSIVLVGGVAGRVTAVRRNYRWPRFALPLPAIIAAFVAFALGAAIFAMTSVFARNPHLVDEVAQLFQGRVYAAGKLAAPIPQFPEFFLFLNSFITPEGWVSQYPPGHPLLLGVGLLVHLEFLVNPLLAAASAYLVFKLAVQLYGPKTALVSTFLFVTSGWVIFMSGTYQSHVSAVAFALLAWVAVLGVRHMTVWRGLLCGGSLGALGVIRPLDAVAAMLPIAAWMAYRSRWRTALWVTVGALPFAAFLALVNWRVFGGPTTFGYTALYGSSHGLGFHTDPFGWSFTPQDAARNAFFALRRVHIYLFEWPIPAALPIGLWGLLARQRRAADGLVAIGLLSLPLCYFFYWHSGFHVGPRFWYGMTPFLAIGTARAWKWLVHAARRRTTSWFRTEMALRWSVVAILMWSFMSLLPARAQAYTQQLRTAKLHPERQLAQLGVERAIVFVPESWISRTVARLWAAGAPAGLVERAVGKLDTCDLHDLARHARQTGWNSEMVADSLAALLAHGDVIPRLPNAPDPATRLRRGPHELPQRCALELARDFEGFTLYGQFAWHNEITLDEGIVFARDLFEDNERLLRNYVGWEVWRYAPPPGDPDADPVLTRVRAGNDSRLAD